MKTWHITFPTVIDGKFVLRTVEVKARKETSAINKLKRKMPINSYTIEEKEI